MTATGPISVDLAIVGAGPAGLYAVTCAGFRGLTTVVLDSLDEVGGQLTALYPEKPILDVAGFPSVLARDLVDRCRAQADAFAPTYLLGDRVETLDDRPVRAGDRRWDRGVRPCGRHHGRDRDVRTPTAARRGGVARSGRRPLRPRARGAARPRRDDRGRRRQRRRLGPDAARGGALHHPRPRRETFRAYEASVAELRASDVRVLVPYEVERLEGASDGTSGDAADGRVTRAVVRDTATGARTMLAVDTVVAALGFTADLGPLRRWGLATDGRAVVVDPRMVTSRPGVYAAGDVATFPGDVPLISVAFGEAAIAVNNAATFIDPTARLAPGHSSEAPHPRA